VRTGGGRCPGAQALLKKLTVRLLALLVGPAGSQIDTVPLRRATKLDTDPPPLPFPRQSR